jgi:hypothetical protein
LRNPGPKDWENVQSVISHILIDVRNLLWDVKAERSDFVLEDAYGKLEEILGVRASLLSRLIYLPQPNTAQERKALQRINSEYKILQERLKEAVVQMNTYLKQANKLNP